MWTKGIEEIIKTKEIPENAIRAQKTFSRRLKNIGKAATAFLHFQKFQPVREKKMGRTYDCVFFMTAKNDNN